MTYVTNDGTEHQAAVIILKESSYLTLEDSITKRTKEKKVLDIKYSTTSTKENNFYTVLIIYEVKN